MDKYLTISQAAERLDLNPETLRRWDKSGKFCSSRHPMNNYRVYSETQVNMLREELQLELDYRPRALQQNSTKPYVETSFGKLYRKDAVDFLRSLEDNSVDLIFADPPYNIKKAQWDSFASQKEYVDWSMLWISEAHRVLKKTGSLYICGFSEILADIKWSAAHLFKGCKWLVWFYRNKANLGKDWGRSHESILHFRKSKDFKFNIDEARIPYNAHTVRYPKRTQAATSQYGNGKESSYVWEPNPLGAKPKDVFEIPTISNSSWERYKHETQKPVELLRRLILSSSHQGDLVLDPFGGSGSTYAVAEAYQRNWLGSELEEEYCRVIKQRVQDPEHLQRIRSAKDEKDAIDRRAKLRG